MHASAAVALPADVAFGTENGSYSQHKVTAEGDLLLCFPSGEPLIFSREPLQPRRIGIRGETGRKINSQHLTSYTG